MNPRLTIRRHGRALGVVGALVAVSATTTLALVAGTASAAPSESKPGTCIDNVNVRAEPSTDAKIVAVCTAGKSVEVAESKDGFVHLTDLEGWAAQEYISVNGAKPARSEITPATPVPGSDPGMRAGEDAPSTPATGGEGVDRPRPGGDADFSDPDATDEDPDGLGADEDAGDQGSPDQGSPTQATPDRSPLSGLLG
jgi:uncharacterized protein YraI